MTRPLVSVVLPVLNEEQGIAKSIDNIKEALESRYDYEIIAVDNGCTDKSMEIAGKLGAIVVKQPRKGYGAAIKRGMNMAKGDIVFTTDADATYDFKDALPMIRDLENGVDVCVGNRYAKTSANNAYATHRSLGNKAITWLIQKRWDVWLDDCNCGLRGITKPALDMLTLSSDGMEFASELIIEAARKKMIINQQPIGYSTREGVSKLNSLSDGFNHFKLILSSPR